MRPLANIQAPLALHLAPLATFFENAVCLAVSYAGDSDTMAQS